ncbi:MAG: hypothetical protein GX951_01675 [Mollicutes bacterium]|nr:hypothetical protein [Mollicutes bacterium]
MEKDIRNIYIDKINKDEIYENILKSANKDCKYYSKYVILSSGLLAIACTGYLVKKKIKNKKEIRKG